MYLRGNWIVWRPPATIDADSGTCGAPASLDEIASTLSTRRRLHSAFREFRSLTLLSDGDALERCIDLILDIEHYDADA